MKSHSVGVEKYINNVRAIHCEPTMHLLYKLYCTGENYEQ